MGEMQPGHMMLVDVVNKPSLLKRWGNVSASRGSGESDETVYSYRSLSTISKQLDDLFGGWPARAGGMLFAPNVTSDPMALPTSDSVHDLATPIKLFAWIQGKLECIWHDGEVVSHLDGQPRTTPTKAEFHAHLSSTVLPHFASVELLPHEPLINNCFYMQCKLPKADGTALQEFIDHLNPETEMDRNLIVACVCTPGWGGPPGCRPAYIFTSKHGPGCGKTQTAKLIAQLWGGYFGLSEHTHWEQATRSMMSSDNLGRRIILCDNVKSRLDHSGLESLITDDYITGWLLYKGHQKIPNYLTVLITVNVPELSRDITDRSVIINIGAPIQNADYEDWKRYFLRERRAALLADVFAVLANPILDLSGKACTDRFGPYQRDVLACFAWGAEAADYIVSIRPSYDADHGLALKIASIILDHTERRPDRYNWRVDITDLKAILVDHGIFKPSTSTGYIANKLTMLGAFPALHPLRVDPLDARYWLWRPEKPTEEGGSVLVLT